MAEGEAPAGAAGLGSGSASTSAPAGLEPAAAASAGACAERGPAAPATPAARGVGVITGPDGQVRGISVSPAAQLYGIVDQFVNSPKLVALPTEQRYALAGKVAAVPSEHTRLIERLASNIATSMTEVGALNSLYLFETCKDLVPGFRDALPQVEDRLAKAAELSPHVRVQAAIRLGEKPAEWTQAQLQTAQPSIILLQEEEDAGLIHEAGRAVGDVTKFVGGAALGGVGLVTDTLGVTSNAEVALADAAEDTVDMVGDGMNAVVDGIDDGLTGTAVDIEEKGIAGTVGDGMADALDMVTDFVGDAVHGIAGGVRGALDYLAGENSTNGTTGALATHKVAIVVGELFGDERSLGLRLENRVVTRFTKPEAEKLGWRLGDCIVAVGAGIVATQDEMLSAISKAKESLKAEGTPIRFIIERLGNRPAGPKKGGLVFVGDRAARVLDIEPQAGAMTVQFQDDGSIVRVPAKQC